MTTNCPVPESTVNLLADNAGAQSSVFNRQLTQWIGESPYLYDVWAPFDVTVDGPHQIPILRGISSMPTEFALLSYSLKPRSAPQGTTVINFWESDNLFSGIFRNPVTATNSLSKFTFVTSPDPTLYASNAEHMRINAIWRSRAVASYFEYRGLDVIPQIRWTTDSDLDASLAGIRKGSVIAVSNHGCYRSEMSKKEFRRGLSRILEQLSPSQLLLHGTDDCRTRSVKWGDTEKIYRQSSIGQYFSGVKVSG
jgi:hypothetical protein